MRAYDNFFLFCPLTPPLSTSTHGRVKISLSLLFCFSIIASKKTVMMISWLVHFTNDCGELIVQNLDMMFFSASRPFSKLGVFGAKEAFQIFFMINQAYLDIKK